MKVSWKQAVLGLAIGLVLGASATFLALKHGPLGHRPRSAEARATRMVEKFTRELELSNVQEERVRAILENKRVEMRKVRLDIKQELRKVLTPEQAAKFEKMEKKAEERRRKRMGEGLKPGGSEGE